MNDSEPPDIPLSSPATGPDGQFDAGRHTLKRVCGAKTTAGTPCNRAPVKGRERCKLHGGATPRGADCANFKHGLYSKALPKNLKQTYDKLLSDPELLNNRGEVALLALRVRELSGRVGSNASVENWRAAQERFRDFRTANRTADHAGMTAALGALQVLLDGAVSDDAAWENLTAAIERHTEVAQREWKRLADNDMVATADQVFALVTSITEVVLLHVKDQAARMAIAEHITRLNVIGRVVPALDAVAGDGDGGGEAAA